MALHFEGEVRVKKLAVGPHDNNVYVVICPRTLESVVIDAPADGPAILGETEGTNVRHILLTHGHSDHIGSLVELRRTLGATIGIHAADAGMLQLQPDFLIADGETIPLGGCSLRAIHTPGHTPGGLCFLLPPLLFSGDTLFPGGPGATAQRLGNFDLIIDSIRTKLLILPDETQVLPGHGLDTTIGTERPHLDEWIARGW